MSSELTAAAERLRPLIDIATLKEPGPKWTQEDKDLWTLAQYALDFLAAQQGEPVDGVKLIAAERLRQIEVEGWTPAHDDEHARRELQFAAASYVLHAANHDDPLPRMWPWDREWWKPSDDPIRNLVKAGALIAAEIDRLQRIAALSPASEERT